MPVRNIPHGRRFLRRMIPFRAMRTEALRLATAALACAAVATVGDVGDAAAGKVEVLGAARPAPASCPSNCVVEARVSGFQTAIGRDKQPFRVPAHGRIVAWSIKLGRPVKGDRRYFNERFGASKARLAVLKPIKRRRGKRVKLSYKLLRQSPIQDLQPFFGETTTFGLQRPMRVRRGNVLALTIPSWAPAFAVGQPGRWRASRAPSQERGGCTSGQGMANLAAGAPQERKGSQQRYACSYTGARLLYSARLVKDGSGRRG
jgi:hypothetical protein